MKEGSKVHLWPIRSQKEKRTRLLISTGISSSKWLRTEPVNQCTRDSPDPDELGHYSVSSIVLSTTAVLIKNPVILVNRQCFEVNTRSRTITISRTVTEVGAAEDSDASYFSLVSADTVVLLKREA